MEGWHCLQRPTTMFVRSCQPSQLPGDIWIYIVDNFLSDKSDLANLSRTNREIRGYGLAPLFKTLKFNGFHPSSGSFVAGYLSHLASIRKKVEGIGRDPRLVTYIQEVELWNWINIPVDLRSLPYPRAVLDNPNETTTASNVLESWFWTYKAIRDLIIHCENIKKLGFLECPQTKHVHCCFPSDQGLLGPIAFSSPGSPCRNIEFTVASAKDLPSFVVPQRLYTRKVSDQWLDLVNSYFLEIVETFTAHLHGALPHISFFQSFQATHILRFSTLQRFGISFSPSQPLNPQSIVRNLRDILVNSPHIRLLELPDCPARLNDLNLPSDALPHLQSITGGNIHHIAELVPGRPIHTVRIRTTAWEQIEEALPAFALSTEIIHTLDLIGCQIHAENLERLGEAMSRLESLVLPWIPDITILDSETMLSQCLVLLESFTSLKNFHVATLPVLASELDIPPTFAPICRSRGHSSLTTIQLGPDIRFIWCGLGQRSAMRRGWIYDGVSRGGMLSQERVCKSSRYLDWATEMHPNTQTQDIGGIANTDILAGSKTILVVVKPKGVNRLAFWKKR